MASHQELLRPASLALLLLASPLVRAQTTNPVIPELGTSLIQVVFGLCVVVLLLVGALHVLKRLQAPRGGTGSFLRTVAGIAVGPRERVVVVEVDETWLVVGVAPGRVSMLHSLPKNSTAPDATPAAAPQDFSRWLRQAMRRQGNAR